MLAIVKKKNLRQGADRIYLAPFHPLVQENAIRGASSAKRDRLGNNGMDSFGQFQQQASSLGKEVSSATRERRCPF